MVTTPALHPPTEPTDAYGNLVQSVFAAGQQSPDKVALAILSLTGAERWSYARLEQAARGAGQWLLDQGFAPGAQIALQMETGASYAVAFLGAMAAGLVPVALPNDLPLVEVINILADCAAVIAPQGVNAFGRPVLSPDLAGWEANAACNWHQGPLHRPAFVALAPSTATGHMFDVHAHDLSAKPDLLASDRLLHTGAFGAEDTLRAGLLAALSQGATALILSPKVTDAHLPLVIKRHDATVLSAAVQTFERLMQHPLPKLPRLRQSLCRGQNMQRDLQVSWQSRIGTPLNES